MPARAAAGLLAAGMVALLARRTGSLTTSGAVAATLVGTAAVATGWSWGALVVLFFVASVSLSRVAAGTKEARTRGVVAKGGARDAMQVLANGGAFAALLLLEPSTRWAGTAALGALASATADTWATEVGTAASATPCSVLTLRRVPPGTSGAVSLPGTLALVAGAAFMALAARGLSLAGATSAVFVGGVTGAMADTLLGATVQERRWCARCERATERRVHDCGAATDFAGGVRRLDNDVVNLAATLAGAAAAALAAQLTTGVA